ncbi:hypothetical protein MUK42_19062 [Musa troglodytarum]|uniref:Uncharacterized protein n=1 Tax=Musa troglodytarum TaxID=320322 RepID=A0A9E7EMS8_9LILI|nr:hypothetical protein MUK42_19062 [Musa troglodytarum]
MGFDHRPLMHLVKTLFMSQDSNLLWALAMQVPFGRARGLCDEIIIELKCNSSQVHVAQQLIEESVVGA